MAFAALVSVAHTLMEPIQLLHDQQQHPTVQLLKSLHQHFILLQKLLEDDFQHKLSNDFEGRIRDLANQTEDIIENFVLKYIGSHYRSINAIPGQDQRAMFMELLTNNSHIHLAGKLHQALEKQLVLIQSTIEDSHFSAASSCSSSSRTTEFVSTGKEVMVGFDGDLMAIKSRLCGESSKLQVVSIVGMGGIGKTTLARNAYIDPLILETFDIRAWVTVSQDYSLGRILESLPVAVKAWRSDEIELQEMVVDAYKSLKGRRYLVVMDDIWSTKAWDDVRMVFPDDDNGSRIILTTRLEDVAKYVDSCSPVHQMQLMDMDKSWDLLREKVFSTKQCPPELEDIGKMIGRSCRGLPLAIVVVAGLLSSVDQTQASWQNIADNIRQNMGIANGHDDEGRLERIFSLSYIHLPHHLRPCFLYIGAGFPEDHKIRVSQLIKLWVAEGFLKKMPSGNNNSKSPEEVAEEYLENLAKRSLVLVTEKNSSGKMKSCSVHDVVRDLCKRKAQEEKFLVHAMGKDIHKILLEITKNQRRLVFCRPSKAGFSSDIHRSTIRTILYFLEAPISFEGFRVLRALDAPSLKSLGFPSALLKLFHLRYLALTLEQHCWNYDCFRLPEDIERIQKLQTLIVQPRLVLPSNIWRMTQLRHILSKEILLPLNLPIHGDFRRLVNLQTLWKVRDFNCCKTSLEIFPNLKKLGLSYHGDHLGCNIENLVYLHQLENLKICVEYGGTRPLPFSGNLGFPTTLKKLSLSGCGFYWRDMGGKIGSLLPNLEVLKLRNHAFLGNLWRTNEGEFPRLKLLLVKEAELKHWITESSHFPSLERLVLYKCWSLRGIPEDIGEIPTLGLIEVDCWNDSLLGSIKRTQEEQRDMGNDLLQIRIIRTRWYEL